MKRIIFLAIIIAPFFLMVQRASYAYPNQLLITPIDARGTPVFFCDGVRQNWLQLNYDIVNINSNVPVHVDSVIMRGDTTAFSNFDQSYGIDTFTLGIAALMPGAVYAPQAPGQDTMWVTVYYGPDSSTQAFYCQAIESPTVGLYGFTPYLYDYGRFGLGGTHLQIETDTLHDQMNDDFPYVPSNTPQNTGENRFVEVKSCGGAIIDSITFAGDFSEFRFTDLPSFPVTLGSNDSLILHYSFIPKIVGIHARPLVFHVHGGTTLVWSFEYQVVSLGDVTSQAHANGMTLEIFPNPAGSLANVRLSGLNGPGSVQVFDAAGRELYQSRVPRTENYGEITLPTATLPNGTYFVCITGAEGEVSATLVIQH